MDYLYLSLVSNSLGYHINSGIVLMFYSQIGRYREGYDDPVLVYQVYNTSEEEIRVELEKVLRPGDSVFIWVGNYYGDEQFEMLEEIDKWTVN